MNIKKYFVSIGLVIGIVIFINILSDDFFLRFDFTENHQYTLSNATKELLGNLEEPVTIKAYLSKNIPPKVAEIRRNFKDLLIEYASRSKGKIIYEIIDPSGDETIEKEAMQAGIQPVLINVREKDQIKQQKAYLGAVLSMGEQKEVIPFMQPGTPLEYALSSSIKKLSVKEKPVVGIIQGQGEPTLNELRQVKTQLEILYKLQEVFLNDSTEIDPKIKTLALIRPTDSLSNAELHILDKFLARGGNLLVAINRVKTDLQTLYATDQHTQVETWLMQKGIAVSPALVLDANCGTITLQQQQGMFRYMTQIRFPYLPIIVKFADHPVVKGLEQVVMPFVSPISFTGDTTISFTPLLFSSEKSATQTVPFGFNVQKQWTSADFNQKSIVLGAALQGKIAGDSIAKMIVLGNGDFAIDGENPQQQVQVDNVNLMVNSIDWLSDDTGLIELRTKAITSRPLDELEDATKILLKYLNFFLPIILIVIYGLFRMHQNKNIKMKRMEENYE